MKPGDLAKFEPRGLSYSLREEPCLGDYCLIVPNVRSTFVFNVVDVLIPSGILKVLFTTEFIVVSNGSIYTIASDD